MYIVEERVKWQFNPETPFGQGLSLVLFTTVNMKIRGMLRVHSPQ